MAHRRHRRQAAAQHGDRNSRQPHRRRAAGEFPGVAGRDSIEHGLEITDAQIAQMLKQGTWYVPTLQVYYTDWDPPDTDAGKRDRKRVALATAAFLHP
jgi:imidazolonepropionase-like amidohydrolase